MRLKAAVFLVAAIFLQRAEAADQICQTWLAQDKAAKIEIYQTGETFAAKIVWLKEPDFEGNPKVDFNNPDAALRSRPVLGLVVLKNLRKSGSPNVYEGGRIYDPKNGKTYDCRITFSGDTLALRGYVLGLPLFGRTATWTAAKE
ncbi:MAG: DUF2147 domain-containing protein [Verrucomicrobiota bacterium]|nr:DUF2147 domain-containing protein [Verrucomicrobiota bacterium]